MTERTSSSVLFLRPRVWLLLLTIATTGFAAYVFGSVLAADGMSTLDSVLVGMFVALFVWIAMSFWMASIGFVRRLCGCAPAWCAKAPPGWLPNPMPPTAILMPVYNEDPHNVLAGLRAIYESLQRTGQGRAFDFFILSDTTNPDVWLAEELAWSKLSRSLGGESRIFYRHRPKNVCRKAGNVEDFCERWGPEYRYMIVLDADSVMSGETLVEMVRRMEYDPQIGILQSPPLPVNRLSLLARCQQFAARVYGPVFLEGFAWWTEIDGNYWGHNAIIRVAPFVRHCGLSALPGAAPLGGEILSHDFVEAALMRRHDQKVCLAHDLDGSYEECPPTLIDFAQRDQRWCQGNMQHIRLIFSHGIRPVSRLHFLMGVMSYVSSPLWLLFMVLSFASLILGIGVEEDPFGSRSGETAALRSLGLFGSTMCMLLLPKLYGLALMLLNRKLRQSCGGAIRLTASVFVESLISMLLAPIMMAFHSRFVVLTLLGRRVVWNRQQRDERGLTLGQALAAHWRQMLAGVVVAVLAQMFAPKAIVWLSPVLAGLILSAPISMLLSSLSAGKRLKAWRLLLIPEESSPPPVLRRHQQLVAKDPPKDEEHSELFRRVLVDPGFFALHCSILEATGANVPIEPDQLVRIMKQLRTHGPQVIAPADRRALLNDSAALARVHRLAWTPAKVG